MHRLKKLTIAKGFASLWRKKVGYYAVALLIFATPMAPFYISLASAKAISDTTPMWLVSMDSSDHAVNVSSADYQVVITGVANDDISGFGYVSFYYVSPSGKVIEGDYGRGTPEDFNVTFYGWLTIPKYAEEGLWRPVFTLTDAVGNVDVLDANELDANGYDLDINVTSGTPDNTAPVVTNFSLDKSTLDTASVEDRIWAHTTYSDNLSEPSNGMMIKYTSPSGNQVIENGIPINIGGPVYSSQSIFPVYSETGTWTISLTIADHAGNRVQYDSNDLITLGFPGTVEVTGNGDSTPVTFTELKFDSSYPVFINIPSNGAALTLTGIFTDNLSGFSRAEMLYRSTTTTQVSDSWFSSVEDPNPNIIQLNVLFPSYSSGGIWEPQLTTWDMVGNKQVFTHQDLLAMGYDLSINLSESVGDTVTANETVTTDPDGSGATDIDPVVTEVTTPVAGDVSIVTLNVGEQVNETNGYYFFDEQLSINAPAATAEAPLTLTFKLDNSKLDGKVAQEVSVFRNSVLVQECLSQTVANPDPCVFSRVDLPDGDVEVKVHTSEASAWALGYAVADPNSYVFEDFKNNTIKAAPELNKQNAGSVIPVKFTVGGDYGLAILGEDIAYSQKINCNTKQPIGEETPISTVKDKGLKFNYENEIYKFKWETLKQWDGTCRQLTMRFSNGQTVISYFKFK
jgi:hypothetical protein